jgi:hypothetical protein
MIIRRYDKSSNSFRPIADAERLLLFLRRSPHGQNDEFLRNLGRRRFGQLGRFIEPTSLIKAPHSFGTNAGLFDIWSGYTIFPQAETFSGNNNTVSFINATWTVPAIAVPLWVGDLALQFPSATQGNDSGSAAERDVYEVLSNVISHGVSCASWIGIQDEGAGGLVQAGMQSVIPYSAAPQYYDNGTWATPEYTLQNANQGFLAIHYPFFQWTSGGGAVYLPTPPVSAGDDVHVMIQILEPTNAADLPTAGSDPAFQQQVLVYFGNLTQDWYIAFVASADDFGATALVRERSAIWTLEQAQNTYNNETPRGSSAPIGQQVMPMARHATVFFRDAVCGAFAQQDDFEGIIGPVPPSVSATEEVVDSNIVPAQGYVLHFPEEGAALLRNPPSGPLIIVDIPFNYVTFAPPPPLPSGAPVPRLPPLGPPAQPNLGGAGAAGAQVNGTAVSAGQLVAKDVIMCKYVYPDGDVVLEFL